MPNLSPRELSKLVSRWAFIREWQQDSVFKIKALQKIAQTLKTLNKEDILAGRCNHLFSSASLKYIVSNDLKSVLTTSDLTSFLIVVSVNVLGGIFDNSLIIVSECALI